jgi:hypothetical protein
MIAPWSSKQRPVVILEIVLGVVLIGMVALSPHRLLYDEPLHLEGAKALSGGMTIHQMLLTPFPSAPGPLYPVLHSALSPLTHFTAPRVRFVNLLLLAFVILCTAVSFRWIYADDSWLAAGLILGIPMTWVTAGMALTEIPALAMASLALLAAAWATRGSQESWKSYAGFMACGLFAGLSIVGRQTYLPILPGFAAIAVVEPRWRLQSILAFAIACAVPLPVFIIWHGLTPPAQRQVGGSIVLEHGLLAFAYLAIVVAILAPKYYATKWRLSLLVVVLGFVVNLVAIRFEWTVAVGIADLLPGAARQWYPIACGSLLIALLFGFLSCTTINVWRRRTDRLFLLMTFEALLLTATAFGIAHLFSSRYVMASFPFVFGMIQPFFKPSRWTIALAASGAALGCASLSTYYWGQ